MKPEKVGGANAGLEIVQDPQFQSRERTVQHIGWSIMALLALAAIIGAFGRGPVTKATAESSNGRLIAHFEHVARMTSRTRLTVELPASSGEVGIWLERRMTEYFNIEDIVPHPSRTITTADRFTFYFQTAPRASVLFQLEPQRMGWLRANVGLDDQSTALGLQYLILP